MVAEQQLPSLNALPRTQTVDADKRTCTASDSQRAEALWRAGPGGL